MKWNNKDNYLPENYGEMVAKKTMQNVFNKRFVSPINDRENQKSIEIKSKDFDKLFDEINGLGDENIILVDKEKLREQLMSIVGGCDNCDLSRDAPTFCNKEPCGYGLDDKLIEEVINNCTISCMKDIEGDDKMNENEPLNDEKMLEPEIITIEEAVYDFQQAVDDYENKDKNITIEDTNKIGIDFEKQFDVDCDVFKAQICKILGADKVEYNHQNSELTIVLNKEVDKKLIEDINKIGNDFTIESINDGKINVTVKMTDKDVRENIEKASKEMNCLNDLLSDILKTTEKLQEKTLLEETRELNRKISSYVNSRNLVDDMNDMDYLMYGIVMWLQKAIIGDLSMRDVEDDNDDGI